MFRFYKGDLNTYTALFSNGKIIKEGIGLNFWYNTRFSSISVVPTKSDDAPFIFTEMTSDFQELAIQGTVTFKVAKPDVLARVMDLTIIPRTRKYKTDDFEKSSTGS